MTFRDEIVTHLPAVIAFATKLARCRQRGHDLAGDTVVKALQHEHQFQPGTNLKAWLFTIAKNQFLNGKRSLVGKNEILVDELPFTPAPAGQESALFLKEVTRSLRRLTIAQADAIILQAHDGLSMEEIAQVQGVPEGTIKSRLSRGRDQLARLVAA